MSYNGRNRSDLIRRDPLLPRIGVATAAVVTVLGALYFGGMTAAAPVGAAMGALVAIIWGWRPTG